MSRNFALLKIVGKEEEYFQSDKELSAPRLAAVPSPPQDSETVPADSVDRRLVDPLVDDPRPAHLSLDPHALRFEMEAWQFEELNKLVHGVFLAPGTESNQIVFLASSESGNGCSWICARAGELLASQVAGRVCLVDANLARPTLHEHFGVPNQHGLAEALLREDSIRGYVSQLSRPNLALVSAGSHLSASMPTRKFSSERLRLRLQELRADFNYILIDGVSLDAGEVSTELAGLADGVVLVLKNQSTRKERTRNRVQELKSAGVRILGAVLNQPAC